MINNDIVPELHQRYGTIRNGAIPRKWWVQDGGPAHRRILVRDRLQQLFPNCVCGLGHNQVYLSSDIMQTVFLIIKFTFTQVGQAAR